MTEPKSYFYETETEWIVGTDCKVNAIGLPSISCGAPPEFHGRAGRWSPEQLFVGSLNSCYMLTLLAVARRAGVQVVSFSSTATGKLEARCGRYQISEVIVRPRIVVAAASDLARMPEILAQAKEGCFISSSVKSAIKILPEIFNRQTPASPCPLGQLPA